MSHKSQTRAEWARQAQACGLKKFWHPKQCPTCEGEVFYTLDANCVQCSRNNSRNRYYGIKVF